MAQCRVRTAGEMEHERSEEGYSSWKHLASRPSRGGSGVTSASWLRSPERDQRACDAGSGQLKVVPFPIGISKRPSRSVLLSGLLLA